MGGRKTREGVRKTAKEEERRAGTEEIRTRTEGREENRRSLRRGRGEGCRGGNWPKRREGDSITQEKVVRDEGKIRTRNEEAAEDDYFEDRKMTATKAGRQK